MKNLLTILLLFSFTICVAQSLSGNVIAVEKSEIKLDSKIEAQIVDLQKQIDFLNNAERIKERLTTLSDLQNAIIQTLRIDHKVPDSLDVSYMPGKLIFTKPKK